jgi:hypothetical protein
MSTTFSTGSGICRFPHARLFLRTPVVYILSGVVSRIYSFYFADPSFARGSPGT